MQRLTYNYINNMQDPSLNMWRPMRSQDDDGSDGGGDGGGDDGGDDGGDAIGGGGSGQTGTVTKTRSKTQKPAMYKVLLLNDDYTPMEFVVDVLERFFSKKNEDAVRIMLHVHQKGVGVCGIYTYEIAETKVTQVVDYARENQHPLQCTLEKD